MSSHGVGEAPPAQENRTNKLNNVGEVATLPSANPKITEPAASEVSALPTAKTIQQSAAHFKSSYGVGKEPSALDKRRTLLYLGSNALPGLQQPQEPPSAHNRNLS